MPLNNPLKPCKHCPSGDPHFQTIAAIRTTSSWCMEGLSIASHIGMMSGMVRVFDMPLVRELHRTVVAGAEAAETAVGEFRC